MSDEKLRELERRFKETGSVEDEAAWLKERVRVGDLTQDRLRVGALLGRPTAQAILKERQEELTPLASTEFEETEELEEWLATWAEQFIGLGLDTTLKFALVVAEATAQLREGAADDQAGEAREILREVQTSLQAPSESRTNRIQELVRHGEPHIGQDSLALGSALAVAELYLRSTRGPIRKDDLAAVAQETTYNHYFAAWGFTELRNRSLDYLSG